jgi:hypothetical protein
MVVAELQNNSIIPFVRFTNSLAVHTRTTTQTVIQTDIQTVTLVAQATVAAATEAEETGWPIWVLV